MPKDNCSYKCQFSDNYFEFVCDSETKQIWIENYNLDDENIKAFFNLLRLAIDQLTEKGYIKYTQLVEKKDWDTFLKNDPDWTFVKEDNFIIPKCLIECDIKNACYCIAKGFGVYPDRVDIVI
jgi:hypothetical protein